MWRSMTRESQCITNMVLLQIGCPPLPLAQYTVTLLQQKKVLREVKMHPFVNKILTKMTEPAPPPNCNSVPWTLSGKRNSKSEVKSWSVLDSANTTGRLYVENNYRKTEWGANNSLKTLLGLKVRTGSWGEVKLLTLRLKNRAFKHKGNSACSS